MLFEDVEVNEGFIFEGNYFIKRDYGVLDDGQEYNAETWDGGTPSGWMNKWGMFDPEDEVSSSGCHSQTIHAS